MKYLILAFIILIIVLFPQNAFADCSKPVSYLKQGQQASCDGYLFSPAQEEYVRTAIEKYAVAQEIINEQQQLIANQDKRIALENERYTNIKSAMDSQNNQTFWERVAWFAAGVVLTSGVVYVSNK